MLIHFFFFVLLPGLLAAIPGITAMATRRLAVGSVLVAAGPLFVWFVPVVFPIFVFSIVMSLYQWALALLFIPIALVIAALTPRGPAAVERSAPVAPWLEEIRKERER